jgi:hypothetical protein
MYCDEFTFAFIIVSDVSSHYVLIAGLYDSRLMCQISKFVFLAA